MHNNLQTPPNVVQEVVRFLTELNSNLGLQGWLIVLTLIITLWSYRSQKRASIREAIEQLDPRHVQYRSIYQSGSRNPIREVQLKAGLNSFEILKRRSKISFVSNRVHNRSDRLVDHSVPPYYLTIPEKRTGRVRTLKERILEHDSIESVSREKTQLVITCSTTNPVECRQAANHVLNEHDHSERNLILRTDFRPWPDT